MAPTSASELARTSSRNVLTSAGRLAAASALLTIPSTRAMPADSRPEFSATERRRAPMEPILNDPFRLRSRLCRYFLRSIGGVRHVEYDLGGRIGDDIDGQVGHFRPAGIRDRYLDAGRVGDLRS